MTDRFAGYVSLDAYCSDICIGADMPEGRAWCERGCLDAEAEAWSRSYAPDGYVLVERDRLDRLIEAGREYRAMLASQRGAYVGVTRICTPVVTEDDVRYEWEAGE